MTDSLRTRIAAAMLTVDQGSYMPYYEGLADAVIRELGLTRRTGQGPYSNQVWYQTDWSIE